MSFRESTAPRNRGDRAPKRPGHRQPRPGRRTAEATARPAVGRLVAGYIHKRQHTFERKPVRVSVDLGELYRHCPQLQIPRGSYPVGSWVERSWPMKFLGVHHATSLKDRDTCSCFAPLNKTGG